MTLSDYHQQFTIKSDAEIQQRINEKEQELVQIFKIVQL
jgi:hypothetical protein